MLICVGLIVVSCSGPPLPPVSEAEPHYQQVIAELKKAIDTNYPDVAWVEKYENLNGFYDDKDGNCFISFYYTSLTFSKSIQSWATLMEVLNPVLEEASFAKITEEDSIQGGWTGISSTDIYGGKLRLFQKGDADLTLVAPVAKSDCASLTGPK